MGERRPGRAIAGAVLAALLLVTVVETGSAGAEWTPGATAFYVNG